MKSLVLVITLFALAAIDLSAQAGTRIDSLFSALAARGEFNGSLILLQGDRIILERSMGLADFEDHVPLDSNSVFELASTGKLYTAVSIGILRDAGKLAFDDPVARYVADFPFPKITIRHLLNHTGGLPDYMAYFDKHAPPGVRMYNQDVLDFLNAPGSSVEFAPGDSFTYSNTGYVVLASVVEKVSGYSYDAFLEKFIFHPLGMRRSLAYTQKFLDIVSITGYAFGHKKDELGEPITTNKHAGNNDVYRWGLRPVQGDGNVIGTVRDHATFISALKNGELLNKATWEELTTSGMLNDGSRTGYGFGVYVSDDGNEISHTGSVPGYQAYFKHLKEQDRTIVYVRNLESWDFSWFNALGAILSGM